jgi:hypothetical protein
MATDTIIGEMTVITRIVAIVCHQRGVGLDKRLRMRQIEPVVAMVAKRLLMALGIRATRIVAAGVGSMCSHITDGMGKSRPMAAITGVTVMTHAAREALSQTVS